MKNNTEALERAVDTFQDYYNLNKEFKPNPSEIKQAKETIQTFLTEYKQQVHLTVEELEGMKKQTNTRCIDTLIGESNYNQAIDDIIASQTEQQKG